MSAITMTEAMISGRLAKVGKIDTDTRSKAIEIIKAAALAGHDVWYVWGAGGGEHAAPPGLALDLMVKNEAAGDWVRNYLWVNRARLRVRHVIWEQHITSTVVSPGLRRKMGNRGSTTANHMDHNHVLFLDGAKYVPPGATPQPPASTSNDPTLERGDTGVRVKTLQAGLKAKFPAYAGHLAMDSSFGPDLERVVMEFQRRNGLAIDGKVGPGTRKKLGEFKIVIPATDAAAPTPKPTPKPTPAPAPKPSSVPTLERGDTGARVKILQEGLKAVFPDYAGKLTVDGSFGPATESAVKEFQRRSRLAVDGKVGRGTRAALAKYRIRL